MKKFTLSLAAVMAMSIFAIAGGDIQPVVEPVVEVVAPVADDSGFYVGLGYSYMNMNMKDKYDHYEQDEEDYTGNTFTVLAGYNFNKYIAVEGRYSKTGDLDIEADGVEIEDTKVDISNIAIYLKPMYPMGEVTLYGLLGYGQVTLDVLGAGDVHRTEFSENSFQWGLGTSYTVNDNISIFVDYSRIYDDDGFDYDTQTGVPDDVAVIADSINVGVTYKF
ncbi:porin family protein [Sulfurovum sp. CS9]|uniref:porin family protein n=1 Tax=Sulfurovum sp. CS9 TaxID=3391146 RepID=UPI0039EB600D